MEYYKLYNNYKLNVDINECLELEEKIDRIKKINSALKPNNTELNLYFILLIFL